MTPTRPEPTWVARRMRSASPPESVAERLSKLKYSKPTLIQKSKRRLISFKISSLMVFLSLLKFQMAEKLFGLFDGKAGQLGNILIRDLDRQRFFFKAQPLASRTRRL